MLGQSPVTLSANGPAGVLDIRAEQLQVNYGQRIALDIASLSLRGRIIAIIGHNGSGKSTLIKSLLGLLPISSGSLTASWLDTKGEAKLLRPEQDMAFSPENGAVFADIPVSCYLELWCRIKHGDPMYFKKTGKGAEIVERLNIEPLLNKRGRELSKGERRRVQTVVGFLCKPRLFLFDEPFDGLDIQQTTLLSQILQDATQAMGAIISSHRMDVVEQLADSLILLDRGQIAAAGSVAEVISTLSSRNGSIATERKGAGRKGAGRKGTERKAPTDYSHNHQQVSLVEAIQNYWPRT